MHRLLHISGSPNLHRIQRIILDQLLGLHMPEEVAIRISANLRLFKHHLSQMDSNYWFAMRSRMV